MIIFVNFWYFHILYWTW